VTGSGLAPINALVLSGASGWSATLLLPDSRRVHQRREHGIDDVAGDCGDRYSSRALNWSTLHPLVAIPLSTVCRSECTACLLHDISPLQPLRGADTLNPVFETPVACSNLSRALPLRGR
jgi:hypothetical protein